MAMIEDLDVFFDEFAITVTVGEVEVAAIFDRDHIVALSSYGEGIDVAKPVLIMKQVDVSAQAVEAGTTLSLPASGEAPWGGPDAWGGTVFRVTSVQPDGTGLCLLQLERVS